MPSWDTIIRWMQQHPSFQAQYAQARIVSAEALEAEALSAVRNADSTESAACARVLLDAVKWAAGKRNPKVYGDKIDHTLASPDGGPVVFKWQD